MLLTAEAILIFQISGELDVAKDALIQITSRLRANVFDRDGSVSTLMPVLPYVPVALDAGDRLDYDRRDSRRAERPNHYPGGYGSSGLSEGYSRYGAPVCLFKDSITCCFSTNQFSVNDSLDVFL